MSVKAAGSAPCAIEKCPAPSFSHSCIGTGRIRPPIVDDEQIDVAVAVDVGGGGAPREISLLRDARGPVGQLTIRRRQQQGVLVTRTPVAGVRLVGNEDVGPAVAIEIARARCPTDTSSGEGWPTTTGDVPSTNDPRPLARKIVTGYVAALPSPLATTMSMRPSQLKSAVADTTGGRLGLNRSCGVPYVGSEPAA